MSSSDWTQLTGALSGGSLIQGVTAGIVAPNGGGAFIYGFASVDATVGAAGLYVNAGSFAPTSLGASVRGAVRRGSGGGSTGFSPFLFACASTNTATSPAYALGLSDADPHHIVLCKVANLTNGLPDGPVNPVNGVLAIGSVAYPIDTWLHLRLDVIVNSNGDVVVNGYANDIATLGTSVATPSWQPIPGLGQFIDDTLHVNTGSAPLLLGYCGFAFATKNVSRRGYFDALEVYRQTS